MELETKRSIHMSSYLQSDHRCTPNLILKITANGINLIREELRIEVYLINTVTNKSKKASFQSVQILEQKRITQPASKDFLLNQNDTRHP